MRATKPVRASGGSGDVRVMIVDDEPTQHAVLAAMCETLGLPAPMMCQSGEAALASIVGDQPQVDCIVCDLDMPGMDGVEFVRRLADLPAAPALMILSGHPKALLDSVERLGADYGLRMLNSVRKPLTLSSLESAIEVLAAPFTPARDGDEDADPVDAGTFGNGVFTPYFQPQIRLSDGGLHGVEVLARMVDGNGAMVPPTRFIPWLGVAGRMQEFTLDIVEKALSAISGWPSLDPALAISINLCPELFEDHDFARDLAARAEAAGIARDRLVFEIVETAVSKDRMIFAEGAARLRLRGFGLAIDDYGQGHASLDQLRRLPFSELKIDRAFVRQIDSDADNRAIVANTIAMAKALELRVIAEGVEREEEAATLSALGCDAAQGFLYSRAVPAHEIERVVARHAGL